MHLTVQVQESASMDIHMAKEFASQELPRFTSALYHAAQTVALGLGGSFPSLQALVPAYVLTDF